MEKLPEKVKRQAGNLNDGQSYERKLLLFIAAYLSQNDEVDNFWIVSNPTGIDKIDDVVARVSFKDSGKKDIALFVQAKLTSPDKLLRLSTPINKKKPTKHCYEIKLTEYEKAFNDVIEMMSSNKPETQELRKLLKGVDEKDYFVCIFTNMKKVDPELQCKQFDGSHPIHFLDTRNCGQYRQFDSENEKFNSNFYKQLYVFLGQPNFVDIDSPIAQLLGEDYKHRLANLDEIVKNFMQRNKLCWVLTNPAFEMNWFKVLAMDWMYIDSEKIEEINSKFERLWQKILADQKLINLREYKIWPLLAYHYQCVIVKEVDENFDWRKGMTLSTKNSIKQKYGENVSDLKELLFLLWSEGKLPLAIRSDCTENILDFLDQFKTMKETFVVFSSEDPPEVITDIKQISESVELLEAAMTVEVSLQGRPPVALSDIGEWHTFSELKIAQVLAWTSSLEDGKHHILGPVISRPDDNYYITRTFTTRKYSSDDNNDEEDEQQREILTVEDVVKRAGPALHIITGEPGMGKSMVLEEVAHKYSSKDFVIYVVLRDCLEDIECDDTWPSIEADPIQYFFSKMAGESDDNISGPIVQSHKTSKRLCLFLDGFDEILPLHGKKLSSLIASILENTAIPIFCTTRPHGEEKITKGPNTIFLELSPFGDEQIRQYLKKLNKEANDFGKKFDDKFLSNPLHLNMISQIYENVGQGNDIIIRGKMEMYKLFIESKHDTYNSKIGLRQNYARRQTERSLRYHRLLALVDILGMWRVTSKKLISHNELDDILDDICEHNIGIVNVSKPERKFCFHHRTYAEYLVADWLLQMLQPDVSNKTHLSYFYEEVMRNHETIGSMIDEYFALWKKSIKPIGRGPLSDRCTKLLTAIDSENEDDINSILKSQLFSLERDTNVVFAFHSAITKGNESIVKLFLDFRPMLLNAQDEYLLENTALHIACAYGCRDIVALLLDNHANLEIRNKESLSPLEMAAAEGQLEIVSLLLERIRERIDVDGHDSSTEHYNKLLYQETVTIASRNERWDVVTWLIEHGADPTLSDDKGCCAMHIAAEKGQLEILPLLLERGVNVNAKTNKGWTPLYIAIGNNQLDNVKWLLEHGADPTLSDDEGYSAMHFAAQKGQLEILALLLEMGLNVNAKSNEGATPLYIAILANRLDTTKWLLEHGGDPTLSDDKIYSAMHCAAKNGHIEILTLLFERGFNVNVKTNTGQTPLWIAIGNKQLDSTKWLLEHGADATLSYNSGWTAMHCAAWEQHLEMLALLLENGLNINAKMKTGETPLFFAILVNHLRTTKWLLDHGADPTLSTNLGFTALHYAASQRQLEVVKLLLERGVNVNATTNTGATPLFIAISNNNLDNVKWLLEQGADATLSDDKGWAAMHYAAHEGELEMLKLLLERGLNVHAKTNTGLTPLCIAISNNNLDNVKWLLQHGADPTLPDDNGLTPMHLAVFAENLEVLALLAMQVNVNAKSYTGETLLTFSIYKERWKSAKWLLDHGADPTLATDNGWTDIHNVVKEGQLEILTFMLERGLSINSKTNMDETLFALAVTSKHLDTVKWLLDQGADPTILDEDGWTAMHYAATEGQLEILTLLLKMGLNVNAQTNTGETPLTISIDNEHWDSVKLLLDHGADITLYDEDGWAAMHYATSKGRQDILELLLKRGLNVNANTNMGETLLAIAISSKHFDTVEWLLNHGADPTLSDKDGWTAMHFAAATGQLDIITLLFERGLNVNSKSNTGETPLTISFDNEHWGSVKWLLEHNVDHTVSRDDGWSAMHYAAMAGKLEILKLLLDRRFNVNVKSNTGETPLTVSIDNDQWDTVTWLLEQGADPTLSRDDGWACIHFAAKRGQLEILIILLDRGFSVNAKTNMSETPLTIAINYENFDTAKWFLEHGADPALPDDDSWTSLHFAAKRGQLEILIILLERGHNVNAETNTGETPFTISTKYKHWDIVIWLHEHGARGLQ